MHGAQVTSDCTIHVVTSQDRDSDDDEDDGTDPPAKEHHNVQSTIKEESENVSGEKVHYGQRVSPGPKLSRFAQDRLCSFFNLNSRLANLL